MSENTPSAPEARALARGHTCAEGRLFDGRPKPPQATRYHSLVLDSGSLPDQTQVSAWTFDGVSMSLHRAHSTVGVQFDPESVLTPWGKQLLARSLEERV